MITVGLDGPAMPECRSQKVRPVVELGRPGRGRGLANESARPPWGTPQPGARRWTGQNGIKPDAAACGTAGEPIPAGAEAPGWHQSPFLPQTRAAAASCGQPGVRDNVGVDIPDRLAWHGGQEGMTDGHG
jgi:hypothetical protein